MTATPNQPLVARAGVLMALPAALLLALLILLPLLSVIVISLTNWQMGASKFSFVGLENYSQIFADRHFIHALLNTAKYVILVAPISVCLGLVIALLISGSKHFQSFYRTVFFLPTIATLAAAAVAWQMLLHPNSGFFNQALQILGIAGPNWLKDPNWAFPTLVAIGIWERVGFNSIFFIAALRDLPKDLFDAATIEGVRTSWERFWLVIWPQLGPMAFFLSVIAGIHAFQTFETVAILTQGGPYKSTQLLIYTIYQEGFVFFRTNYAAAATVIFILILALFSTAQFARLGKRVHYS